MQKLVLKEEQASLKKSPDLCNQLSQVLAQNLFISPLSLPYLLIFLLSEIIRLCIMFFAP